MPRTTTQHFGIPTPCTTLTPVAFGSCRHLPYYLQPTSSLPPSPTYLASFWTSPHSLVHTMFPLLGLPALAHLYSCAAPLHRTLSRLPWFQFPHACLWFYLLPRSPPHYLHLLPAFSTAEHNVRHFALPFPYKFVLKCRQKLHRPAHCLALPLNWGYLYFHLGSSGLTPGCAPGTTPCLPTWRCHLPQFNPQTYAHAAYTPAACAFCTFTSRSSVLPAFCAAHARCEHCSTRFGRTHSSLTVTRHLPTPACLRLLFHGWTGRNLPITAWTTHPALCWVSAPRLPPFPCHY